MSCFAQEGFAQRDFLQGCDVSALSSISDERIPRWLLKFERTGSVIYLSDVGGDVEDQFYVPAVIDVSVSALQIDLERMSIPSPSATVHISPSALEEFFLSIDDLGQAKVTVSSWDGHTARKLIVADMQQAEWGYDGEATSFRLTEEFRHNPKFPSISIDIGPGSGWTRANLASGARFRVYPQVWGSAQDVPMFGAMKVGSDTRYMIAGHNVATLPTGPGTAHRYKDGFHRTWIGAQFASAPSKPFWKFKDAQGVKTAGDLIKLIVAKAGYTQDEIDQPMIEGLYFYLSQFSAAGFSNDGSPIFGIVSGRWQRQYLFVMWQEGGLLKGTGIRVYAEPERVLVMNSHLLQLQDPIGEETKYTDFKVRYKYLSGGSDGAAWYGLQELYSSTIPYLKELARRWGKRNFGDPIEVPLHADSIDLADVLTDATAKSVIWRYAHIFHRGQKAKYLQFAEFADMPFGMKVALVDPERGYDEKPAILIGRQWLTPELIVQTYRTIEPFEIPAPPARRTVTPVPPPPDYFMGLTDPSWTKTSVGAGASYGEDSVRVERSPQAAGYTEQKVARFIDSADWGTNTRLQITVHYVLALDAIAGIPTSEVDFFYAPTLFESDQTGTVGTQDNTITVTLAAPWSGIVSLKVLINGSLAGSATATFTQFQLLP